MEWSDIGKSIIKIGAPVIGGLLGGPGGAAIGTIVSSALGCNDDPESVSEALKSNPNAINKIIALEQIKVQKMQLLLQDQQNQREMDVKNTIDARNRETKFVEKGTRDWTPTILAISLTIGFFTILLLICFFKIQPDAQDILKIMIGALGAAFSAVIGYYFGSSKGSQSKDAIINTKIKEKEAEITSLLEKIKESELYKELDKRVA